MTNSDPENMPQGEAVKTGVWDYTASRPPVAAGFDASPAGNGVAPRSSEVLMAPVEALTATPVRDAEADKNGSVPVPARRRSRGPFVDAKIEMRHGFRIGDLQLMIRYEDSSSISEMYVVHRLPNAPEWCRGIVNMRGKLIPVFDLSMYMGIEHRDFTKEMLLVLGHGNDAVGVFIDGTLERLRLAGEEGGNLDAAPARLTSHLRSSSLIDGEIWYDLDVQSLVNDLEHALKGFA